MAEARSGSTPKIRPPPTDRSELRPRDPHGDLEPSRADRTQTPDRDARVLASHARFAAPGTSRPGAASRTLKPKQPAGAVKKPHLQNHLEHRRVHCLLDFGRVEPRAVRLTVSLFLHYLRNPDVAAR